MSKRYTLLLSVIAGLFVLLVVLLCFYSRLSTDDYYFAWDVRHNGINESVYSQYMAWSGRFAATWLGDLAYKFWDVDQTWYFLYPLSSFLLLVAGLYRLTDTLSFRLNLQLTASLRFLFALIFTTLLFFLSIDIGETWIWYCSLSSYLWSIIAFVWGCAFLFGNGNKLIAMLLSCLCFIYAGGASEVYSVIYGVLILVWLIYQYKKTSNLKSFLSSPEIRRLLVVYMIFGISFLIFLIAPGNYLRDELFPKHEILKTFFITAKSIVKFGVLYLPVRIPYIIAFAVPFLILGRKCSPVFAENFISFKLFFRRATILFSSLLLLFFLIVAYVMVETGPPRLWFMAAFLFACWCTAIAFYAGYSGFINDDKIKILKTGGLVLSFLVLLFNLVNQYPITSAYAKANDERVTNVMELNKKIMKDTLIVLPPLPSSGMVYSAEISADTNHFTNRELRLGYDLKFHVISEKK